MTCAGRPTTGIKKAAIRGAASGLIAAGLLTLTGIADRRTQLAIVHVLHYVIPALLAAGLIGGLLLFKPWRRK